MAFAPPTVLRFPPITRVPAIEIAGEGNCEMELVPELPVIVSVPPDCTVMAGGWHAWPVRLYVMAPALGTTICEAAVESKPVALPLISTVPLTVKMPPRPIPTMLPEVILRVLVVATALVVLVNAVWLKLTPVATVPAPSVVLPLQTSFVEKIVLVVPVNVSVPVPATVNEAKLPVVGVEVGTALTVNAPLQVIVTSSLATGAPAGDQTIAA